MDSVCEQHDNRVIYTMLVVSNHPYENPIDAMERYRVRTWGYYFDREHR